MLHEEKAGPAPATDRGPLHKSSKRGKTERTITTLAHDLDQQDIAALAYEIWQARGCPEGSPNEDWFQAVEQLNSRN